MTEHWVQIYPNQKKINYISPSNIRVSVETRPPKLHNLLQLSPPSIPGILWASPASLARFCETRISVDVHSLRKDSIVLTTNMATLSRGCELRIPLFLASKNTMTNDTARMSYFVVLKTSNSGFS